MGMQRYDWEKARELFKSQDPGQCQPSADTTKVVCWFAGIDLKGLSQVRI